MNISLSTRDKNGNLIQLDAEGNLRLELPSQLVIEAEGFLSENKVVVWLFSTPIHIGSLKSSKNGVIAASLKIPESIEEGNHRVVLESRNTANEKMEISIGVVAGAVADGPPVTFLLLGIVLSLSVLLGGLLPVAIRRRRQS